MDRGAWWATVYRGHGSATKQQQCAYVYGKCEGGDAKNACLGKRTMGNFKIYTFLGVSNFLQRICTILKIRTNVVF